MNNYVRIVVGVVIVTSVIVYCLISIEVNYNQVWIKVESVEVPLFGFGVTDCIGLRNGNINARNIAAKTIDGQWDRFNELNLSYTKLLKSFTSNNYSSKSSFLEFGVRIPGSSSETTGARSKERKLILLWTTFFDITHYINESNLQKCGLDCKVSTNKDDLRRSNGVVVHGRDFKNISDLPQVLSQDQYLLYFIRESPQHVYLKLSDFNGIFNLTSTYRRDSDVFNGYGRVVKRKQVVDERDFERNILDFIQTKTNLVAAIISNCDSSKTARRRVQYVERLALSTKVDFYGACGNKSLELPRSDQIRILSSYKFILSFENSHCRDYITEKFWNPLLLYNSVPIAMGGSSIYEYLQVAPPNSFIHTRGFSSPEDLAVYINILDSDVMRYRTFHAWRRDYERGGEDYWCQFCRILQQSSAMPHQSYRNFSGWYAQDSCPDK